MINGANSQADASGQKAGEQPGSICVASQARELTKPEFSTGRPTQHNRKESTMDRTQHALQQGTDAWHQFRFDHDGASEAAAMLGLTKKTTRNELLRMKKTGIAKEFSDYVQEKILDRGHEIEALTRPMVESLIGESLYPVTYSLGRLSASCDGLTADDETAFECKSWNADLSAAVARKELPDEYMPQCQQVLLVTGAKRLIFACSDGTPERFVWMEVLPDPEWVARIEAGWAQFHADLDGFVVQEVIPAERADHIDDLPALTVQLFGGVQASNLADWKAVVTHRIQSISTDLNTEKDFVNAAKTVTFLGDGEKKLELVKSQALAQTSSIAELFSAIDSLKGEMKAKRLELNGLVEARKKTRKAEIVQGGKDAFEKLIADLNAGFPRPYMPAITENFGGCIKGLSNFDSIQNAVDTELARVSIVAKQAATLIKTNLQTLEPQAEIYKNSLFADLDAIVLKPADHFALLVKARIEAHEKAESDRLEKIREEERIKAEAKVKAEAEEAERKRLATETASQPATPAPPPVAAPVATAAPESAPPLATNLSIEGQSRPGPVAAAEPTDAELYHECNRVLMSLKQPELGQLYQFMRQLPSQQRLAA